MRIHNYRDQVAGSGKRVLLCEPDARIVEAAQQLRKEGIVEPVLVGDTQAFSEHGSIEGIEVIPVKPEQYEHQYYELRKHKDISQEEARKALEDPALYSCMLLRDNQADGLVCGATWPTARTLRAALHTLRKGRAFSYFILRTGQGDYVFADCAFNIQPTAEELAEIAYGAGIETQWLGLPVNIAMLSFSTYGSAKHADQEKVARATQLLKEKAADKNWKIGGEMQVDAALDKAVGKSKAPDSQVQGDATVFIFPDLDAANIGYKLVQRFAHDEAVGPIISGLAKPVNDLSRGCTAEEAADTCYVTAWQSMHADQT